VKEVIEEGIEEEEYIPPVGIDPTLAIK